MNAIRFVLILLLLLASTGIQAGIRSQDEAMALALTFRKELSTSSLRSSVTLQSVAFHQLSLSTDTENPPFYIFNVGENQGFIIVSSQTATKTILGYSDKGSIKPSCIPDNLKAWLQGYEQEIATQWETAPAHQSTTTQASLPTPVAPPLLDTNNWQQLDPFNQYCPWDSTANARSSVGCVALAMGQVMRYHQWPPKPNGTYKVYPVNKVVQFAAFDTLTYDWSSMPMHTDNTTSEYQNGQISRLLHHIGLSVQMQYSAQGSGTDISMVGGAMVRNFNYDTEIQHYKREHFMKAAWDSMLRKELDESRPVIYGAFKGDAGHVFVCDGYDSNNLFHINWGWGGNGNGYFELTSLNPDALDVTGASQGFSMDQSIVVNIKKPDQNTRTTYSLGMTTGNISTPITVFKKNSTFFARFDCKNFGTNTFEGQLGLAYLDRNNRLKPMESTLTNTQTFLSGYVKTYYNNNLRLPSDIGDGLYQMYAIFRPKDSLNWIVIPGINNISLSVSNDVAKIFYGNSTAILELKSNLFVPRRIYQNKTMEANIALMNYDIAFSAGLSLEVSTMDGVPINRLNLSKHNLQSGQIHNLTLNGKINCPPGKYRLLVKANSPFDDNYYSNILPSYCNNVPIEVFPEPGPPDVQLVDSMQLTQFRSSDQKDSLMLKAKIINRGGFWDDSIGGVIYPAMGGNFVGMLAPKNIYLDSLETYTLTLYEKLKLAPGNYTIKLCQWVDSIPQPLHPLEQSSITFTVDKAENSKTDFIQWYLSEGRLIIPGEAQVEQITLFSLYGVQYAHVTRQPYIQVSTLPKGAYILKVRMNGTVYTSRYFRD